MLKNIEQAFETGFLQPAEVWDHIEKRLPFPISDHDVKHAKMVFYAGLIVAMWMNDAIYNQTDEVKKGEWQTGLREDIENFAMHSVPAKGSA